MIPTRPDRPGSRRRALRRRASLTLVAIALSVATGFAGYAALQRTSEFNRRNFVHLANAAEARRLIDYVATPDDMRAVMSYVERAIDEARWCLETSTRLERAVLRLLDAEGALRLCEADLRAGEQAMDLVQSYYDGRVGLQTAIATLSTKIADMMAYSAAFEPYVARVERQALAAVMLASALLGAVLTTLVWRANRTTLALWDAAQRERKRLDAALAAVEEGFAIFDARDRLLACNEAYRQLSSPSPERVAPGLTRAEIMRSALAGGSYGAVATGTLSALVEAYLARLEAGVAVELVTEDDRYIHARQTASATGDRVVVLSDRTLHRRQEMLQRRHAEALAAANQEVERQAREDALTALPNRRAFEEALAQRGTAREAARVPGVAAIGEADEVVLVRIDLDDFKYVNDVFGHAMGDAALRHVADILRDETRAGDIAARIGGDEFVLLLAPGCDIAAARTLIERLRARLAEPMEHEGKVCRLSASCGIAASSSGAKDADELLCFADTALYEAKVRGRARAELFTPAIHARLVRNRRLADELREGLENGEFEPFFQPQFDARSLKITGAEVLARWRRPDGRLRQPGEFLEIAGGLRLTAEIDAAILDRAAQTVTYWQKLGVCPPKLAFNVSSQRMHEPGLVEAARRLAGQGPRIAFELLESTMIEEESQVFAFHLDALKEAGIGIEIDDFGSGRASVLGVIRAGPDTLKIDQRLIRPLLHRESMQRMVRAIVEIGRALDVSITAEGVETMQHARMLTRIGCDTLQGYAFAPPLSAEAYAEYARAYVAPGSQRSETAG
jgi:diguanylate cyclase (GGDEF)-like protein